MPRLRPRRSIGRAALLAAGLLGLVGYYLLPTGGSSRDVVYQAFGVVAFALLAHRASTVSGSSRLGWASLAAGIFCFTVGDAAGSAYGWFLHREPPYPSIADVLYLAGFPFLAAGLVAVLKDQVRWTVGEILEDAVVTASAGLTVWIFVIEPLATEHDVGTLARLTSAAYPTLDLLLVAALLQLTVRRAGRNRAGVFVAGAIVVQLAADLVYSWMTVNGSYTPGSWIDGGWLISYLLWGAAALAQPPRTALPAPPSRTSMTRMWLLSSALLIAPLLLAVQSFRGKPLELEAVLPISTALGLLVFARFVMLIKQQGRAEETNRTVMVALQASEARNRSLMEHLPLVVYAGSALSAAPSYVAPQFETIFGYPPTAWQSDPGFYLSLVHDEDRPMLVGERALVESGEASGMQCEYRVRARDGRELWVLDALTTMHDERGLAFFFQGFLLDVSDRRLLEAELQQAQRMEAIGQLAGGLAHDFNNILMSISGHSELMLDSMPAGEPNREHVEQVAFAAARAADLTRSLLAFARRQILKTSKIDLTQAIRRIEPMLIRLIGEDIAVVLDLASEPVVVDADSSQIEQVILNLAINARHAMPDGGSLGITVESSAGEAILRVSDNGHGMDAATRARVFEPFFTTKGEGKGTGLGLAMAHGVVDQSGGRIDIDSEVGRGTTITICLPLADAADEPAPELEPAAVGGPARLSKHVLLVEDDASVRGVVAAMLGQLGHDVVVADGPSAAIALCTGPDRFDLMITDIVMPEMHGTQLAEVVQPLQPPMHVLFISGYASTEVIERGGFAPEQHHLQKPFNVAELESSVRAATGELAEVA